VRRQQRGFLLRLALLLLPGPYLRRHSLAIAAVEATSGADDKVSEAGIGEKQRRLGLMREKYCAYLIRNWA